MCNKRIMWAFNGPTLQHALVASLGHELNQHWLTDTGPLQNQWATRRWHSTGVPGLAQRGSQAWYAIGPNSVCLLGTCYLTLNIM